MISLAVPERAVPGSLQEQPREVPGGSRGGPPLKLLAKAKSDENERRQKVRDLTRPGPAARRIMQKYGTARSVKNMENSAYH